MTTAPHAPKLLTALLWLGRALAVLVCCFWGMFFVEHLSEWFRHPFTHSPPAAVWWAQGLHFLMLAGLLLLLRWEWIGGALVAASGYLFLSRAGANFPLFYGLTLLPVGLIWAHRWLQSRSVPAPGAP